MRFVSRSASDLPRHAPSYHSPAHRADGWRVRLVVAALRIAVAVLAGVSVGGCADCGSGAAPSGAASATPSGAASTGAVSSAAGEPRPVWLGSSAPVAQVMKILNPKGQEPYDGPRARLRGRITITGDTPTPTVHTIPSTCGKANDVYGRLFRVDAKGGVADALVAVTGYDAFVPPTYPAVKVPIDGCAFERRTLAMTYGQRLEIENADAVESYMPYLDGSKFSAIMVAVPLGSPIPLNPQAPGQYLLRDAMKRPFLLADVFVLKYATAAVTGLDGSYVIENLPVGKVRVDALLPIIRKTAGKDLELKEGDNDLDLELTYDADKDAPSKVPEPVWGSRVPPAAPPPP